MGNAEGLTWSAQRHPHNVPDPGRGDGSGDAQCGAAQSVVSAGVDQLSPPPRVAPAQLCCDIAAPRHVCSWTFHDRQVVACSLSLSSVVTSIGPGLTCSTGTLRSEGISASLRQRDWDSADLLPLFRLSATCIRRISKTTARETQSVSARTDCHTSKNCAKWSTICHVAK